MRSNLIFSLAVLLAGTVFVNAQNTIPEDDFQIWNETAVVFPLVRSTAKDGKKTTRVSFLLLGTLRLGQNRAAFVDERIGAGVDLVLTDQIVFTPSYLYRATQPGRGRLNIEHQVRFDLSYEKKWGRFSVKDRNRVEYRIQNSRSDVVDYRNKLSAKYSIRKGDKEIFAPFIAAEPFYNFNTKRWVSHEFSAGISRKLTSAISSEIFYLQKNNTSRPKTIHAVGMNLRILVD